MAGLKGTRGYPALASHTVRVLRYSSRLNMMLESILLNMYSPERPNARSLSFVRSAHERLDEFWQGLPKDLRLERGNMPAVCPPSNMVLLKCASSLRLSCSCSCACP